jgi:hypothetical protein
MSQKDKNFLSFAYELLLLVITLVQATESGFIKLEGELLSLLLRNDRFHNAGSHNFCPHNHAPPAWLHEMLSCKSVPQTASRLVSLCRWFLHSEPSLLTLAC